MEEYLSQIINLLVDLVMTSHTGPKANAQCRHGIDLKTHSQCQRAQGQIPRYRPSRISCFHTIGKCLVEPIGIEPMT